MSSGGLVANSTRYNWCIFNWQSTLEYLNDGLWNLKKVSGYYIDSKVPFHRIMEEIMSGRPIGFRVVVPWGGHIMLITGYSNRGGDPTVL